jgi:hypothetical protein
MAITHRDVSVPSVDEFVLDKSNRPALEQNISGQLLYNKIRLDLYKTNSE